MTTVVAGSINICTTFKMARRPFLRDNIFYLVAVIWTFVVIYQKQIKTAEASGIIVIVIAFFLHQYFEIIKTLVNYFETA